MIGRDLLCRRRANGFKCAADDDESSLWWLVRSRTITSVQTLATALSNSVPPAEHPCNHARRRVAWTDTTAGARVKEHVGSSDGRQGTLQPWHNSSPVTAIGVQLGRREAVLLCFVYSGSCLRNVRTESHALGPGITFKPPRSLLKLSWPWSAAAK